MESQEEKGVAEAMEKPSMRMVQYYYINYKQFVNVVKCKLHQMRMKLEDEDNRAVNGWHCNSRVWTLVIYCAEEVTLPLYFFGY